MTLDRGARRARRGWTLILTLLSLTVVVVVVLASLWTAGRLRGEAADHRSIATATRRPLRVTLPVTGALAAAKQIEIRNELEAPARVVEVAEEGSFVGEGDLLIRFADEHLRERVAEASIELETAGSEMVAAEIGLAIQESTNESRLREARLKLRLAELELDAWGQGDHVSKTRELRVALETAERNLERLERKVAEAGTLLERGFISQDEYDSNVIELLEAKSAREKALLDIQTYEKFRMPRERAQKESDVEQAAAELARVESQNQAELTEKRAALANRRAQLDIHTERVAKLREQVEKCTVRAPGAGLVVYATSLWSRGATFEMWGLQVGYESYPNEILIFLPDTSELTAIVTVHESWSGRIRPGQTATIRPDARSDLVIHGEVASISVLASETGWRDPNRREYRVKIRLSGGNPHGLKPSTRCAGEIVIESVDEALLVPIQAIARRGDLTYVHVPARGGFAERAVTIGRSSELEAEIVEGLVDGESVLVRTPMPGEVVSRLAAEGPLDTSPPGKEHE